jgi:hypothetical protein
MASQDKDHTNMKQITAQAHSFVTEYLTRISFPAVLVAIKSYPAHRQTNCQSNEGVEAKQKSIDCRGHG